MRSLRHDDWIGTTPKLVRGKLSEGLLAESAIRSPLPILQYKKPKPCIGPGISQLWSNRVDKKDLVDLQ
jgi:hypothetical protein